MGLPVQKSLLFLNYDIFLEQEICPCEPADPGQRGVDPVVLPVREMQGGGRTGLCTHTIPQGTITFKLQT